MAAPYIASEFDSPWEFDGEQMSQTEIRWKTLVSADKTPSQGLSMGILEVPRGAMLGLHRHAPQETYYVIAGAGSLLTAQGELPLRTGDVVYLPNNEPHGVRNTDSELLKLVWTFPTHTWAEFDYHDA